MGDGPAPIEDRSGGLGSRLLKAFGGGREQPKEVNSKPLVQDRDPKKVGVGTTTVSVITTPTGGLEVAFLKAGKDKKVRIVGSPRLLDGTADDKEEVLDTFKRRLEGGATIEQIERELDDNEIASVDQLRESLVTKFSKKR